MKRSFYILFTAFITVIFASCGPTTMITGSWINKSGFEGKQFNSVFIAALTGNLEVKGAIEDAFSKEAALKNITSIKSIDFFKSDSGSAGGKAPGKDEILNKIRATNSEAILTINLKDSKNATRYVEGTKTYEPVQSNNYYNNFYGYYQTAYVENYTEGYYTTDKVYFLECNLYNAENEELLWSAQSQTTNPSRIEAFAKEYAAVIVEQLRSDRMLKAK